VDLGLSGRVAVVGGSSEGLGYAIARLLAEEGADVAVVARRREKLEDAAGRIAKETGRKILPIAADIRRAEDCERIVETAAAQFGRLDILVNNDGAPPLGELSEFDDDAWDKAVQRNLMSAVRLSRRALPHMQRQGWGRILNITALSVLQPRPRFGLSIATWAGLIGYAKTLSLEVAAAGITVNTLCPGRFATGRLAKVFTGGTPPDAAQLEEIASEIPMRRLGEPEELAAVVAFLVSARASYVTGATLQVDGGRLASLY
jgi:3-oxoacyl-[acyl-carrier protein] reductase